MTLPSAGITIAHHLPPHYQERSLRDDVHAGLGARDKWLPPKWFYDERGSELFEMITELPEYYPTRAEREVLETYAGEMASTSPVETLIELGSGSSRKTPLLLSALQHEGQEHEGLLRRYIAVDVSDSALLEACGELSRMFPDLEIDAVAADFENQLHVLPHEGRRMVALLGGTIGNLEADARASFLRAVHTLLADGGGSLLLGSDLVKSADTLVPAYDDVAGVTADFNRNVLRVLNRKLGADFDVEAFEHVALWRPELERIEMRLRASKSMTVNLPGVGMTVRFDAGEDLRTEISTKFRPEGIAAELAAAGLTVTGQWTDSQNRYAMTLAEAV